MTGADCLLQTAAAAGVRACFANPGTTELPLVAALGRTPEVRPVLCLFEGVCTGAADGYARMAGVPALTLLHTGPGLANGLANLHNARRAGTPVVNLVGDQATWHRAADPPLATDVTAVAGPFSDWVGEYRTTADMAAAVAAALAGKVATLVVPQDVQQQPGDGIAAVPAVPPPAFDPAAVRRAADVLRRDRPATLLLGGPALMGRGLRAAGRVAARGVRLLCQPRPPRIERGGGLPVPQRLPYFPEHVLAALKPFRTIVLAGAREPVSFFGYDGYPSRLITADQEVVTLATRSDDVAGALEALADELGAPPATNHPSPPRAVPPTGPLTAESIAAAVAAVQPEGAIVVDEGITSTPAYFAAAAGAPPHTYLTITGGSIGFGPPCATGAAVASPGRKVIALQADGSGLYTPQALWTQAREGLDVVTVVFANRRYRILDVEAARDGGDYGPVRRLFDLTGPAPDWVRLAGGFGVPGVRVETADDLAAELRRALAADGPRVIEVIM